VYERHIKKCYEFFWNSKNIYKVNNSNNLTYPVKIRSVITDGFRVGNGLKEGVVLAPNLFNITLKYVIKLMSVRVKSTISYVLLQLIGCADIINVMGRVKSAVS
jgi:hypothetical protein